MKVNESLKSYQDIKLIETKSGHLSAELDGCLLHSRYDPVKEAKKFAEKNYKKNHLHILFGLGLGYQAKELLNLMGESDALFIIEPNAEVFETAKKNGFLKRFLGDKRMGIYIEKARSESGEALKDLDKVLMGWLRLYPNRTAFSCLPNYDKLYPDVLKILKKKIKDTTKKLLIDVNTMHFFALKWQKNFVQNLYTSLIKAKPFKGLVGRFSCPIVITSGGPSLIKQLDLLRKVKNKCIVLCAGSTIGSLLKHDVKPHCVVTVDGSGVNYTHFKDINIDNVLMIYELMLHHKIPEEHSGAQAVFNFYKSREGLIKKLQKRDLGTAFMGFSVANTALSIAAQLTSGPICVIGQDLAYTDNLSHADGNKGLKEINLDSVKDSKIYTFAKGYYGDEVLTDYAFLGMKDSFEKIVSYYKNVNQSRPIVNSTEGGLHIDGMDYMPFKEFVDKYCTQDSTGEVRLLFEKPEFEPDVEHFYKQIKKYKNTLNKVIEICESAKKKHDRVKYELEIPNSIIKSLENIDKKLVKFLKDEFMKDVLEPVIFRVYNRYVEKENETPEEKTKRVLKKSKALYAEIKDAAEVTKEFVEELIKRVERDLKERE